LHLTRLIRHKKLVLGAIVAFALKSPETHTQQLPSERSETEANPEIGLVDKTHAGVSRTLYLTANWLDAFFGDERAAAEENRTLLKISLRAFGEAGEGLGIDPKISLKLRLPRLSRRLQLEVTRDTEADFALDAEDPLARRSVRRVRFEDEEERGLTAALRYFVKTTRRANISLQGGLRVRFGTPIGFVGPRYRGVIHFEPWALRFTQRLRWFTENRLESNTRLDLERPFAQNLFFRTTTGLSWFEDENNYFYDLSFFLFQPLSKRHSLGYEWNNYFQERQPNNHLEEINLRMRYRQNILKDWLFFEVVPQISFPKDRNFDFTPGIQFRCDLFFGGKKALEGLK
jgi:hypothetical protein